MFESDELLALFMTFPVLSVTTDFSTSGAVEDVIEGGMCIQGGLGFFVDCISGQHFDCRLKNARVKKV